MKTIIAAFANDEAARQAADELRASDRRLDIDSLKLIDAGERLGIGKLTDRGVSQDRAHIYSEAVRRGAALLIVDAEDQDANEVASLLDNRGSLDLDMAAQRWRSAGWTGYQEEAVPYDQNAMLAERDEFQRELPVIEEEVRVGKREVERGGVRLRSFVTERPIHEQVELREERVEVTRRPVNEPLRPSDAEFTEDEFVVTTKGEEAVVEKQARVVERVGVEKTADTRTETIEETERRQDVEVEKLGPGTRRP